MIGPSPAALWDQDRGLLTSANPDPEAIGTVEMEILGLAAASPADARAKLLLALDHCESRPDWLAEALWADDMPTIYARSRDLDLEMRLVVDVIRWLEELPQ